MQSLIDSVLDNPSFTISTVAELTGLHPQTIRSYEQRGLLTPHRTPGGTRMYTWKDVTTLQSISAMSCAGITIEGISRILELESRIEDMQEEMKEMMEENMTLRSHLHRERAAKRAIESGINRGSVIVRGNMLPPPNASR